MSIPEVNARSQEFAPGLKTSGDGYFVIHFHPKLPILVCDSISQVLLLFSIPTGLFNTSFSNWKKTQIQHEQSQMPMEIIAMDWNMNGTQLAAGCSSGNIIVWDYPSGEILFEEESHLKPHIEINWNLFQANILASLDCDHTQLLLWNSGASDCTNDVVNTCCTVGCKESMSIAKHEEKEDHCEFEDKQEEQFDKINWISSEKIAICFDNNNISEISDHDDSLNSRLLPFLEQGRGIITPRNNKNEAKHFSWFFDLVLLLAVLLCFSLLLMTSLLSLLAFLMALLVFLTFSAFFAFWALSACLTLALMFRLASVIKK